MTPTIRADMTDQKTQMREGFEAQRKAGMNVDWFTWQIAWHDALFTVHDLVGDATGRQTSAIDKGAVGQWVHCSPSLLNAGVSCANTPRRACECNPENGGHDHFIAHSAAPIANEASKPAETHDRLLAALERAATAESALRALVDECENDSVAGWEDRMQQRINHANRLLSAAQPMAQDTRYVRRFMLDAHIDGMEVFTEFILSSDYDEHVHDLEALCDPSGLVAENALLRDQTKMLDAMIGRLKREVAASTSVNVAQGAAIAIRPDQIAEIANKYALGNPRLDALLGFVNEVIIVNGAEYAKSE